MSKRGETIHLGFEVGTGRAVALPVRHMVVTGQTQEAGKTTTLEAMIHRGGRKAITFITKRGEGSFRNANRIQPYFREQADWQFVSSILEASRGEKLKFERAWIIRASKGAKTLADVHRNVKKELKTAKGLSGDVYLTLDAYLDQVVPEIGRVRWASIVALSAGINVMDLTEIAPEMQHLVIKSTIEWVLKNEHETVVVVPEAWKFVPQARGTPVKLAAEGYIRQGAGLGNYLWLDSQDIAGVDKTILKNVPVWVLGVQRERNEIERTLNQIPMGIKRPKAEEIATLKVGQFFACWGDQTVKVYVQPVWMDDIDAQGIAAGNRSVERVQRATENASMEDPEVTEAEARALRSENTRMREEIADLKRQLDRFMDGEPIRSAAEAKSNNGVMSIELIYPEILERLRKEDPKVLHVAVQRPEIQVVRQRRVVEVSHETLRGRIASLISTGFFDTGKAGTAIESELRRQGFACSRPNCYREADKLSNEGFLTKEDDGYRVVPGMKVNIIEN